MFHMFKNGRRIRMMWRREWQRKKKTQDTRVCSRILELRRGQRVNFDPEKCNQDIG